MLVCAARAVAVAVAVGDVGLTCHHCAVAGAGSGCDGVADGVAWLVGGGRV